MVGKDIFGVPGKMLHAEANRCNVGKIKYFNIFNGVKGGTQLFLVY